MPETPRARRRGWFASAVAGVTCGLAVFAVSGAAGVLSATPALAASETSSAVTVTARQQDPVSYTDAPFPDLSVTVSQTKDLRQQGVTVSWTGATGHRSVPGGGSNGGSWFLQVFQCWGDDPTNSNRPDRTTCQYGGVAQAGATRDSNRRYEYANIPTEDQPYSVPRVSGFQGAYTSIPFRARNGTVVSSIKTGEGGTKVRDISVDVNNNQFFTSYSTNEVPWVGSGADGTGALSFEMQTTMQSPGLGCGDPVNVEGAVKGASCWLVVLPRGAADNGSPNINQSGLFSDSWKHALAVRTDFAPVGARCTVGAAERQLAGSEIASLAVQSWQPTLCQRPGGAVYSHLTSAESDALAAASSTPDAPLALTSYPLTDGSAGLVYAPVALSGIAISFVVDRNPDPLREVPAEFVDRVNLPFEELRLTPRLLAKLVTNSYWGSLPPELDRSYLGKDNPENITRDKDFLAVNSPEWAYQSLTSPALADVLMPQGRSDAARAIWTYIMSDSDAAAFMNGVPDPNGMTVNPWYSTDALKNPSGAAFQVPRDDFAKADPAEAVPGQQGPINVVTWRPYVNDLDSAAYLTLRGDGQVLGAWDPNSTPAKYGKPSRLRPGFQKVLGVSDTAASARYQVRVASLRNVAGQFVVPTETSLLDAAAVMRASDVGGVVRGLDSSSPEVKNASSAYPLAVPIYAAANPVLLSSGLRTDYAAFVRYAVTNGQKPGISLGQLPTGYAPIPKSWVDQSLAAADLIEKGAPPAPEQQPETTAYIPSQTSPVSSAGSPASAQAASAQTAAAPPATGNPSAALAGGKTPGDPDIGGMVAAVPASVIAGAAGAAAVPLITRLRRRVS